VSQHDSSACYLGLDIGTSGSKGVMLDAQGRLLAESVADHAIATPRPGWTEQEPADWWAAVQRVCRDLVQRCGPPASVGLTGQMHGAVFLDADDAVIRPALLWNDQRTAEQAVEVEQLVGAERLRSIAGNPSLTGFQAPKLLWLRTEEPAHWARLARVLLPKDFIRLRLTDIAATDASDAAGTLLLDLTQRDWSDEILAALDIPRAWLPTVFEGPEITGEVTVEAARLTGLEAGTPVVAGGGDNAAAAVANGALNEGDSVVSVGTSGVVFAPTDAVRPDPEGAIHAFCHAVPGRYHLMGVMLSAGGSLQWAAQTLAGPTTEPDYECLLNEAAEVPPGAGGLYFLPYLAGERTPHMDPYARGAWAGLSLAHGRGHLIRAVLEGVSYGLRDAFDRVEALNVTLTQPRLIGGGMRDPVWREILVSALGRECVFAGAGAEPATGAAILAAAGVSNDTDLTATVAAMAPSAREAVAPAPELAAAYEPLQRASAALYPAIRQWQREHTGEA
jgi:xylulokinase